MIHTHASGQIQALQDVSNGPAYDVCTQFLQIGSSGTFPREAILLDDCALIANKWASEGADNDDVLPRGKLKDERLHGHCVKVTAVAYENQ